MSPTRCCRNDKVWHLRRVIKRERLPSCLHLDHSLWVKPLWLEDTQAAFGEVHTVRSWGLLPTATWVSHLGGGSSGRSQVLRWLQFWRSMSGQCHLQEWPELETYPANLPWIPDQWKLCEIISVYCLKLLSYEGIIYTAIYIQYNTQNSKGIFMATGKDLGPQGLLRLCPSMYAVRRV